jgi:hypothetical protein
LNDGRLTPRREWSFGDVIDAAITEAIINVLHMGLFPKK